METIKNRFEFIHKYSGKKEKSKILDIGTGNGKLLLFLYYYGYNEIYGIDNCNLIITELEKKYIKNQPITHLFRKYRQFYRKETDVRLDNDADEYNIEFFKFIKTIKLSKIDFFDFNGLSCFNLIIASNVFHFYPSTDDEKIIEKIKSILCENGLIYLRVRSTSDFKSKFDREKYKCIDNVIYSDGLPKAYLFTEDRINKFCDNFFVEEKRYLDGFNEIIFKNY